MSRRKRHNRIADTQRAVTVLGGRQRPISPAAMNAQGNTFLGDNSTPVSAYTAQDGGNPRLPQLSPGQTSPAMYPPGDPLRPTPGLGPRMFGYPIGSNIGTTPRGTEATSFDTLRNLAALYDGVKLCEKAYFRILERLSVKVMPRTEFLEAGEDLTAEKWSTPARQIEEWFAEGPDKRGGDLTDWMIAAMRDLLEIDAVGVYHRPTRGGGLYALELIAGDTILPLFDIQGRAPLPPAPAYRQVLYGAPAELWSQPPIPGQKRSDEWDAGELDYWKMTTRTDSLYGDSPVESILLTINRALRKQNYDLTRFTDGATPEGVIESQQQELFKMTVDEVREWELAWNGVLSGNDAMRVRTKFVPPGFHFVNTKPTEIATAFDEWLLNITISAFGLTKDELGFTDTSNRSVGKSQEAVTYRQAVMPKTNYFARRFNRVNKLYDRMPLSPTNASVSRAASPTKSARGSWDSRFVIGWSGIEEPEDLAQKTGMYISLVQAGIVGRTQAKRELGLTVLKGEPEVPPMFTVQGGMDSVVLVEDLVAQHAKILEAQKAQIETKIAGAKAAQEQFKAGGNPVQAAGMAAGNVNAGAKQVQQQQIAAGGQTGGQAGAQVGGQTQAQEPAQKPATKPPQKAQRASDIEIEDEQEEEVEGYASESQSVSGRRTSAVGGEPGATGGWDAPAARAGIWRDPGEPRGGDAPGASAERERDRGAARGIGDALSTPLRGGGQVPTGQRSVPAVEDGARSSTPSAGLGDEEGADASGSRVIGTHLQYDGEQPSGMAARSSPLRSDGVSPDRHDGRDDDGWQGSPRSRGTAESRSESERSQEASSARREASSEAISHAISSEWARYRDRALSRIKQGKGPQPFVSEILPADLHAWVAKRLMTCTTRDEVRTVFAEAKDRETREREVSATQAEARRRTTDGEVPTGAMIAFFLPDSAARRLAVPGGEPADSLHITLAYLGKAADWSPEQVARLRRVLAGWASEQPLVEGRTMGLGTFPVSEDGKYPVYAQVDAPRIYAFRESLVKRLDAEGFFYDKMHPDYKPHITLQWVGEGEGKEPGVREIPLVSFEFPEMTLAVAGDRYTFAVGDEQYPAQVAPVAEAVSPAERMELLLAGLTVQELRSMRSQLFEKLGVA